MNGTYLRRWGSLGAGGVNSSPAFRPNGVAVAGDGSILVADYAGAVVKFSAAGALLARWGSPGTAAGVPQPLFSGLMDVAADTSAAPRIYVADSSNGHVAVLGADGSYEGQLGAGMFSAAGPIAVAVTPDGRTVWALDGDEAAPAVLRFERAAPAGAALCRTAVPSPRPSPRRQARRPPPDASVVEGVDAAIPW